MSAGADATADAEAMYAYTALRRIIDRLAAPSKPATNLLNLCNLLPRTGVLCSCCFPSDGWALQVKDVIEEHRLRLGYGTHQVLFNIDLFGKTSGTYSASVRRDCDDIAGITHRYLVGSILHACWHCCL